MLEPTSLLKMASHCKVPLPVNCRAGACGACAVRVIPRSKDLQITMTPFEKRTLKNLGKLPASLMGEESKPWIDPHWRLACQCMVGSNEQFLVAF